MRAARLLARRRFSCLPVSEGIARSSNSYHRNFTSSSRLSKVVSFNLPDIGEGIAEVEVLQWHVKAGDKVSQFDKLIEVQSDKATVDITSRYDGVIRKLHYDVGQMAPTGKPLLDIETTGEGEADTAPAADAPESASGSSSAAANAQGAGCPLDDPANIKTLATPAVRRVAREHNVSLSQVSGTGKDGRVLKEDVVKFVSGGAPAPAAQAPAPAPSAAPATAPAAAIPAPVSRAGAGAVPADAKVPVRGLARAMVKSMTSAWAAPHFGYCDEIHMDGLMALRGVLKPVAEASGLKLSFLPMILKATSLALEQFPQLNAHVAGDASEVTHKGSHNIGIAMDTPRGLIVPNVKGVQQLSILEIAQELARLQALAAAGKLGEADLSEGTFTLSNIGTIGGTYASPVLFAPQVAIGAIGKIVKSPRYASTMPTSAGKAGKGGGEDPLVPAHIMTVSWAADHRVVDGATMARFSNAWKRFLESPQLMLAQLR